MMTEEKVKELTKDIQRRIKSTNRWLSSNKSIGNPEGEAFRQIEIYELALSALTQPASPALKLPDEMTPKKASRCYGGQVVGYLDGWNACIAEVKRLNAPHTAPIEPICATGGAEWVKVSDVEIEQELISLQNGNGQLRGESFYREALKELLAMRSMPIPDEFLNAQQNASGMFEISEDCMCQLLNMLCSKP